MSISVDMEADTAVPVPAMEKASRPTPLEINVDQHPSDAFLSDHNGVGKACENGKAESGLGEAALLRVNTTSGVGNFRGRLASGADTPKTASPSSRWNKRGSHDTFAEMQKHKLSPMPIEIDPRQNARGSIGGPSGTLKRIPKEFLSRAESLAPWMSAEEEEDHGRLQLSLRTFFMLGFFFFLITLIAILAGISIYATDRTKTVQKDKIEEIQSRMLDMSKRTNNLLIVAAEESVKTLMLQATRQLGQQISANIKAFSQEAVASLASISTAWSQGAIVATDMDATLPVLWRVLLDHPTLAMVNFADSVHGNFIAVGRSDEHTYTLELQNTSSATCTTCEPGADPGKKYYYLLDKTALDPDSLGPPYPALRQRQVRAYNATLRPWYAAAFEPEKTPPGQRGDVHWADARIFTSSLSIGVMATTAVSSAASGSLLGVVGSDIDLAFLSKFLRDLAVELETEITATTDQQHADAQQDSLLQMAVLDLDGIVLGSTLEVKDTEWQNRTLDDAHWARMFKLGTPLRLGLDKVSQRWGGDLHAAFDEGRSVSDDAQTLLVQTTPYGDEYGLRVLIVAVVEKVIYRGQFQAAMDEAEETTARDVEETNAQIQVLQDEVGGILTGHTTYQLVSCALILAAVTLVMFFVINNVTGTLQQISENMGKVSLLDFSGMAPARPKRVSEISAIESSFEDMRTSLQSFARYVPESVMHLLVAQKEVAALGVAPHIVSIMFSDIANFTSISERVDPVSLISLLEEYLDAMSGCIQASHGTVGKYIGDGIFAFWNSPFLVEDHPAVACSAALQQQERLAVLRQEWIDRGLPAVHARIGLSVGTVLHGNIGSRSHMEWGLIGDEVNLSSRLEAMCKQYGVDILISHKMYMQVEGRFLCRLVDRVVAVGKTASTDIYQLVCEQEQATPEQIQMCEEFAPIVEAYRGREFDKGLQLAIAYLETREDKTAKMYRDRCRKMAAAGEDECGPDWDFTCKLTEK